MTNYLKEQFNRFTSWLWDILVRWRTWIVNLLFVVILSPEVLAVLLNYNWGTIVPKGWMPYVLLAQAVINVWMRPRPALRAKDPEVQIAKELKRGTGDY